MQGGTALRELRHEQGAPRFNGARVRVRTIHVAGSLVPVPDIFPGAPCIPGEVATDYSRMRARCEWCGMEVEVLASGRCLLGHAVTMPEPEAVPAAVPDAPPTDLTPPPRRSRVRRRGLRGDDRPASRAAAPPPEDPSRSIQTAPTPPRSERPPMGNGRATLDPALRPGEISSPGNEALLPRGPRVSRPWAPVEPDGPSGPILDQPDPGPAPLFEVGAPGLGASIRLEAPPEPAGRSPDIEGALRELLTGEKPAPAAPIARPAPSVQQKPAGRLRLPFRWNERRRSAVEPPPP
ncbi:MAG: hypothetical protein ACRDJM_03725, partial [Actinomycetota bacterium]